MIWFKVVNDDSGYFNCFVEIDCKGLGKEGRRNKKNSSIIGV